MLLLACKVPAFFAYRKGRYAPLTGLAIDMPRGWRVRKMSPSAQKSEIIRLPAWDIQRFRGKRRSWREREQSSSRRN